MKIPNDQRTDMQNTPVGMLEKRHKEIVKEMVISASNVCNHD